MSYDSKDLEKGLGDSTVQVTVTSRSGSPSTKDEAPTAHMSRLEKFQYYNEKLESAIGIEARGIERVPDDARHDTRLWGNLTIWLSANFVLATFGVGILGPLIFGMGLGDSMLTIFFFVIFSTTLPAMCSTFGPKLGLRQMTSARYAWGFWGAKFVATLSCIACVGWSIASTIGGAQVLSAVGEWSFSAAVGTVIIGIATLLLGLCGYKVIHRFERVAWIPAFITYLVLLGVAAKHLVNTPMPVGQAEAASVLSFGGVVWGFCTGWVSLASDYNVYMPSRAPAWRVFMWTYIGIALPCVIVMWIGAALAAATVAGKTAPVGSTLAYWWSMYEEHEVGGLLHAVLVPPMKGGGKFFMVLLVLSVIANNIINVYSMGMSISVISNYLAMLPRLIWPIVITAIYVPIAIVGADHFSATLHSFLSVLGYWLAIFVAVIFEEHFIFRKADWASYDPARTWNSRALLPIGIGAMCAFCFGAVGAAMGMAQTFYVSPIGKLVGGSANPFGGDIGFELASVFTLVTYPLFRWLEIKYFGK